jgi:hypothetical protein
MLVRRDVLLPPGAERAGDDPAWRDALVLVVRGQVELGAPRRRFGAGSVLVLEGLAVRNPGPLPAALIAYARGASGPPRKGRHSTARASLSRSRGS